MTPSIATFGEIMLRLSPPGYERFLQSPLFVATFGGGEANVAVSVAQFGTGAWDPNILRSELQKESLEVGKGRLRGDAAGCKAYRRLHCQRRRLSEGAEHPRGHRCGIRKPRTREVFGTGRARVSHIPRHED